jgi:phosphopantetheinyl transferase/acyl carrier protein
MSAFSSMVNDSVVCLRLDALPCEVGILVDRILSPAEREHWKSMRGVEKRRREWLLGRCVAKQAVQSLLETNLDLHLSPEQIEIVPDPYGRPLVSYSSPSPASCGAGVHACSGSPDPLLPQSWPQPALSIAHSQGAAVALAALDPQTLLGVDLESLTHRRENFAAIAFSTDERQLLAALPPDLTQEWALRAQEWALRMWCAKEAVGKALGRGLSAGLLAFHITRIETSTGIIEIEVRDAATTHLPQLRGKSLIVYTARKSNFVFSTFIYQQGAVPMRPSRQEILDYLLQKMGELTQDWDYPDPVGPESLLFTELGFESLDAVVLCTAIQEHYQTPMPFAELLAEIGEHQRDLSIDELTDFVNTHLDGPQAVHTTGTVQ